MEQLESNSNNKSISIEEGECKKRKKKSVRERVDYWARETSMSTVLSVALSIGSEAVAAATAAAAVAAVAAAAAAVASAASLIVDW